MLKCFEFILKYVVSILIFCERSQVIIFEDRIM